jgi:hypothetical protein
LGIRPDSLSAFKWNACPPSPESALFKAQGSTEAQHADTIAVLSTQCGMVGDTVTLLPTGENLDSEASRKWL